MLRGLFFGIVAIFIVCSVQAADVLEDLKRLDGDIETRRSKATAVTKANEKKILLNYLKDLEGNRGLARGNGQLNGVVFFDHEIKRTEKALINDPNLMFELDPGPNMPNGAPIQIPLKLQKMRAKLRTDLGAASGRMAAYDKKLNQEKRDLFGAAERRLVRDNRIDDAKWVRGQIQLLGLAPNPAPLVAGPVAPASPQGFRPVFPQRGLQGFRPNMPPVGGRAPVPDLTDWTFDASNNAQSFEKLVQKIGVGCYQS